MPGERDGQESATITYTCEGGDDSFGGQDGLRGLGHLTVDLDGSALVLDFEGPKGGWGGMVDSYRRT
ncbi:hypothetical protein [Streptomyces morookaense]|uniref:Uncharacterized protein n=1 Tax=Streptomyces morookaense TaxID=1970 RepID=A0A7Y7E957_STRMO|nr:hypothetical protein [Streptomyces morookaense]NVK80057.1 hypothetical protein [Streptomyces morookaense]GHF41879.1 hypothetical protein GCM10010359_50710 [Streptomyces morookaense]